MKIIDQHVHTNYSPDADPKATMQAYVDRATKLSAPGIMFTDHVDFDTPVELFQEQIDYQAYRKEIEALQAVSPIPILMGVEIGYQPHLNEALTTFLHAQAFDIVICSIHVGDGLDFYNGDYFKGKTQREAYQRYFEIVLESVNRYDNYDVYGHIDYIIRYGDYQDKTFALTDYELLIDEILTTIIRKGKGIELNTSGMRYGLGVLHPQRDILKRYKALGGTIVTLGSDAHKITDYQADFDYALRMLIDCGFEHVAQFVKRTPTFIALRDL